MAKRNYGQFCGLAHAADLVGERWALLIIRDLLVSAKRFTDLRRGLPRIPTNVLSARLKQLEADGVIERRVLPRPEGSVVYSLTDYGHDLEPIVHALGRWGARSMGEPKPDDIVTPDSLVIAMRSTFQPDVAAALTASWELRAGPAVIHVKIDEGKLTTDVGELPDADLTIETGPAIKALMAGELTAEQAIEAGHVRLEGNPALLTTFAEVFRI
ncbi:HxlR family transcriptional regulator [Prauserella marina]|uniref:DNA-binding transcriptional regulator, HxlR family n=1 Tax=Prauserella marina TaxID=530584 RepID=A0A222VXD4_9PSEU|nr:winged helix-turn-helix transcriptional regulator [Prauserella marina]ASR38585.1 HxlR family transcriptional regulator [Prauserella marina]PWV81904.1 HxlR family transcriptional regulator [Prauserella marina]SDD15019.1 DNA-binding transcriptional regulator, HxlR family [Prauserella marina]